MHDKWTRIKEWLDQNLRENKVPRQIDIVDYAKQISNSKLNRAETIRWLKLNYPSYRDHNTRPNFKIPRRAQRMYMFSWYTTLAADLCFLGPRGTLLREIGTSKKEFEPLLVAITLATKKLFVVPMGKGGKSSKAMVKALTVLFSQFEKTFNETPKRILFDQEKAMQSASVTAFLTQNQCKVFFYKYSRSKSVFAEASIRSLRSQLAVLRARRGIDASGKGPIPKGLRWHDLIFDIVKGHNERPIYIYGKKMSMTPNQVNEKIFLKFRREVEEKFANFNIVSIAIDPSLFKKNFKIPLGSRVKIKRRAIELPGLAQKFSEKPLTDSVWIVKKRAVYLSKNWKVILVCIVEEETNKKNRIQIEEAALQVLQ